MWNKITNPETGRKVSINGAIGKKILKNYIYQLSGGATWGNEDDRTKSHAKGSKIIAARKVKKSRSDKIKNINRLKKVKKDKAVREARQATRAARDQWLVEGGAPTCEWCGAALDRYGNCIRRC